MVALDRMLEARERSRDRMGMPMRWLGVMAVVAALASPTRADDGVAGQIVDELDASLQAILKDAESLGYQGRRAKLGPVIDEAFDVPFMAEKALGAHWKALDEAQRAQWITTFRNLMHANWAARFDRYTGQEFKRVGQEPSASGTLMVRTVVTSPGDEDVELSYRLRGTPAGPRIIDVYLKGTVSELALRRSEYSSVFEREGFPALLATVDRKIADLTAGKVAAN
jgi:phospholipid transport system substrate-binding protein